jgi:hypothetical protein
VLVPQVATETDGEMVGLMARVEPVQARRVLRWESRQSVVPSRWRTQKEVSGDLEEMSAVMGDGEVIFWYRKGMPAKARRRGESRRSVEIVLEGSAAEERPTRVPRRVKRSWEGERETERSEDGEPRISKVASAYE